jgi:beta-glucanase (GH16 family)
LIGLAGLVPVQAADGAARSAAPAAAKDACGDIRTKADGSSWDCSFVDNFDGRELNPDKWITQQTEVTGFRSGLTCFTTAKKNLQVSQGTLKLVARNEKGKFLCQSPTGAFTTTFTGGMIGTRTKFSQTFGRFEVRAKLPTARRSGVHGGFWMFPLNLKYGTWPASGEIDIAEWWSNQPTVVMPSLHYNGRDPETDSGWDCRVSTPSAYHTYALEWLPSGLKFFIDGELCFSRTPDPAAPLVAPQPFDHPFSMILNMGVGPGIGNNAVSPSTPLPATYTVDYVKAWR